MWGLDAAHFTALIGAEVDAARFVAASAAVIRAIDADLPAGVPTCNNMALATNIASASAVFERVMTRVLVNPTGVMSTATLGQSTSWQGGEGVAASPLSLRRAERDILAKCTAETSAPATGTSETTAFVVGEHEW